MKEFLHAADVGPGTEHVDGDPVAKEMRMHSLAAQSGAVQLPQPVAERRLRNGTIPGTFFVGMTSSQDAIESYTRCTPRLFSPATMGRNLLTRPCQPDNRNEHEGMTAYRSSGDDEGDADRLRGLLATGALSVELASAFAGDRPLTDDEKVRLVGLQEHRGERFFSDLLYAITHQFFAPAAAEKLWVEILQHKYEMSRALCRNVRITVATLDFLSNCRDRILLPTLVNEAHIAEIVEHALRDGLTGLFNHTSFMEMLELELRKSARYGTAVSLIMADIDDFKDVNDRHGHQEGDRVLVELAGMIMKATRDSDICCRYGGEEFAVILPFTDAKEAVRIAERIRLGVMGAQRSGIAVTVSFGVASHDTETPTAFALVGKADRALYQAKHDGKNRVVTATPA